jgi:hypothetical protein
VSNLSTSILAVDWSPSSPSTTTDAFLSRMAVVPGQSCSIKQRKVKSLQVDVYVLVNEKTTVVSANMSPGTLLVTQQMVSAALATSPTASVPVAAKTLPSALPAAALTNAHTMRLFAAVAARSLSDCNQAIADGASTSSLCDEWSLLGLVAFVGFSRAVTTLVAAGADPNQKMLDGSSPLYIAMQRSDVRMVTRLLHHGAVLDDACQVLVGSNSLWSSLVAASTPTSQKAAKMPSKRGSAVTVERSSPSQRRSKRATAAPSWLELFPETAGTTAAAGDDDEEVPNEQLKSALLRYGTRKQLFAGVTKSSLHAALDAALDEVDIDNSAFISSAELERALDGATLEAWLRELVADATAAQARQLQSRDSSLALARRDSSPTPPVAAVAAAAPAPAGTRSAGDAAPASLQRGPSLRVDSPHEAISAHKLISPSELAPCEGDTTPRALSRSESSSTYRMHWSNGPFDVAVKTVLLAREDPSGKVRATFEREAALQANLSHPHLVGVYGIVLEGDELRVVMPLMARSLRDALESAGGVVPFAWPDRARLCAEMAAGLHFLHTRAPPMLHRDLKSSNVMLTARDEVQLMDFGLAEVKKAVRTIKSVSRSKAGSSAAVDAIRWSAPELLALRPQYGVASDIFALGMVAYELTSGLVPYADESTGTGLAQRLKEGKRPTVPPTTPASFASAVTACWPQEAAARPTALVCAQTFRGLVSSLATVAKTDKNAAPVAVLKLESSAPGLQMDDDW